MFGHHSGVSTPCLLFPAQFHAILAVNVINSKHFNKPVELF